jgi:hypothetical protein
MRKFGCHNVSSQAVISALCVPITVDHIHDADPPDGRRAESEQEWRKESAMKANVGDWLVIKGTTTERSDQRGLITEVHSADGSPPYVVRWLATGHVATVVPGPDAIVVTPEEQEAADERAQERAAHRGTND